MSFALLERRQWNLTSWDTRHCFSTLVPHSSTKGPKWPSDAVVEHKVRAVGGKRNVVSLLTCMIMICFCKHVPFLLLFSGMAISPSSSPFLSTPSSALPHRFSSYGLGGMRTGVPGSREMFRLPDIGRTACHWPLNICKRCKRCFFTRSKHGTLQK